MKILAVGDSHIDTKAPPCRTDDYFKTCLWKLEYIIKKANENEVDCIIHPGDLLSKSRPDQAQLIEIMLFGTLSKAEMPFLIIPGNHDLPYHNINNINKSSLGVLNETTVLKILNEFVFSLGNKHFEGEIKGFPYGIDFQPAPDNGKFNIAVIHEYVFANEVPPFIAGHTVDELIDLNPGWDLIISGHNHQSFGKTYKDTLVINPGEMLRLSGNPDHINPRIALIEITEGTIHTDWINIPIEKDAVTNEYLVNQKARDQRINEFIDQMQENTITGLDFYSNMENYLKTNKINKTITDKIWEVVE